jgi:OmpA-OmpF porin, OOP family
MTQFPDHSRLDDCRLSISKAARCKAVQALAGACIGVLLGACSGPLPPVAEQSAASTKRITDRAIFADQLEMQGLQDRLAELNRKQAVPLDSFVHAKTQCWLDVAAHEYHRNDRSGFIEHALEQTRQGLAALERGQAAADSQPSERMFCSQAERACRDVRQAHAMHEEAQFGWRHARPYHAIAQDLDRQVRDKELACAVAKAPEVPAPPLARAPMLSAPVIEPNPVMVTRLVLQTDALFGFDQYQEQSLSALGRQRLDGIAKQVLTLVSPDLSKYTVSIVGFADRLGNESYNQRLAGRRAATVKQVLSQAGLSKAHMVVSIGDWSTQAQHCKLADRKLEIACLAADRRVEILISRPRVD